MMRRWAAIGVAMVGLAASGTAASGTVASADPDQPRPGGPCGAAVVGAMTWLPGEKAPLVCSGNRWQSVSDPYPHSDRWVSHGPTMTLRGGARQNPALEPGDWTATPLDSEDRCRAEQVSVTYGKVDGPPRIDEGAPGRPLSFQVVPALLTIEMDGHCLWQKVHG